MPRLAHGGVIRLDAIEVFDNIVASKPSGALRARNASILALDLQDFDYMFPGLQTTGLDLLPVTADTVNHLVALGRTMRDPGDTPGGNPGDSQIPAIFTYLGQFLDHDVTFEALSASLPELVNPSLQPLSLASVQATIRNTRTATLDLDSIYGLPAPPDPTNVDKLLIGTVFSLAGGGPPRPVHAAGDDHFDLPREAPSVVQSHDRAALIGDPRNDENLVVAQLHLAFLRAHNAIVDLGNTFSQAQALLRQHYQHIVLNEFLPTIADPAVVSQVLLNGNQFFTPTPATFFMPLEFSVAAYRFGHTMIRANYDFNINFPSATLQQLFTFTALSGQVGGFNTLPDNWIIEWDRLLDPARNPTRKLDTKLVEPLFFLQEIDGSVLGDDRSRLAVRNLLRGYLLRMPTGQAVAKAMGLPVLTPEQIIEAATSRAQSQALDFGNFQVQTPLWYYILAEAAHQQNGERLGAVGSTIVAEVLIQLIRQSQNSILGAIPWAPTLPSAVPGTFFIADLLRLAKVMP